MQTSDQAFTAELKNMDERSRLARFYDLVRRRWRPYMGWPILLICLLLSIVPATALILHEWISTQRAGAGLPWIGPIAVLFTWIYLGWRRARRPSRYRPRWVRVLGGLATFLAMSAAGIFVLSQLLLRWIPAAREWVALFSRTGDTIALTRDQLTRIGQRYVLWWQGVQGSGAAQDDLVFATIAGMGLWFLGVLTVWLVRRTQHGLVAALPVLWVTALLLIYASEGRLLLVWALLLGLLLHLTVDQFTKMARWEREGFLYSPEVVLDRMMVAALVLFIVLTPALFVPSFGIDPIVDWYYGLLQPIDDQVDDMGERLFPELSGSRRRGVGGIAGGMPNAFLLDGGQELGRSIVMQVRTSEGGIAGYSDEIPAPPGHYMRSATFALYNGRGWENPSAFDTMQLPANETWSDEELEGRKMVVQSVVMKVRSPVLFAAPEPIEPALDYRVRRRSAFDLIALYGREESYTISSLIPALSDEELRAIAAWEEGALPPELLQHLELPVSTTERTRQLATQLTAQLQSPYAKAEAIEAHLRTYEYDLTVPEAPESADDVADFFLFDLQRGYCDYYATAFVVLARAAGLPARFATGYAVGSWDPFEAIWTISEAEAHSWPEVWFPQIGWIPFEPTAGRPALERIGLPQQSELGIVAGSAPTVVPIEDGSYDWSWQMLLWLAPLGLLLWGTMRLLGRYWPRSRDPWDGLLRWGRRIGRPLQEGETTVEYGAGLAAYVLDHHQTAPDVGRLIAREVIALSRNVSTARYGSESVRNGALQESETQWEQLRGYLRAAKMRRAETGDRRK